MLKPLHEDAIKTFSKYLESLNDSNNPHKQKQADLISYWVKDYIRMISLEDKFEPAKNIVYHRGDILQIHFGYRIGSEHGGLHYAVVIDDNPHNSPVITVVPLVSMKKGESVESLHPDTIYLGNELYDKLKLKRDTLSSAITKEITDLNTQRDKILQQCTVLKKLISEIEPGPDNSLTEQHLILGDMAVKLADESQALQQRIDNLHSDEKLLEKMKKSILKMNQGSVAIPNQITTVSKIRIYDPRKSHDILCNIKLSNEGLDAINAKLKDLFIHE